MMTQRTLRQLLLPVLVFSAAHFAARACLPPAPPTNCAAAAVSSSQITLSWNDNSSDEDGFVIFWRIGGGSWGVYGGAGANQTSLAVPSLTPDTTYQFYVTSCNFYGTSSASNVAGATVLPAPTSLTASAASSAQINLSWSHSSPNESGFRIERSTNGTTFSEIATVGANVTSFQDTTGLCGGTHYYYRVRAYATNSNSSYSAAADATTQSGSGIIDCA